MDTIKLPRYKELVEWATGWEYGSIHSHNEIAEIMDVKSCSPEYYGSITRANKALLECGKRLINLKAQGYKVLSPDDYIRESQKCVNQAGRRIKQAAAISQMAPTENMSEEGRKRHQAHNDRLMSFGALMQGASTELRILAATDRKPKIAINGK